LTQEPRTSPIAYKRLMAAACVAMIVFGGSTCVLSICLRDVGDEFRLSLADRGLLGTVRMIALVTALLASGYFADRLGKRPFLVWGMALIAAASALTARAGGYASLVVAQGLVGAGSGALECLVNPLVAQLNPHDAARRLNVVNGLFSVGLVIAALSTGEMLQAGVQWRIPFWLWVVPAAVGAALLAARHYPSVEGTKPPSERLTGFVRNPLFWLLCATIFIGGGVETGMTFWGANYVESEIGASARSGAMTVAVFGTFMALGRFASGALLSRVSPVALMIGSAAACAVATAGLSFVHGLYAAWAFFALGGLFVACFWPTLIAVGSERISTSSASLFALLAASGISGCAVFPWVIGAIGDASGLRVGVTLMPASMVLQVVILAACARIITRRSSPQLVSGG